MRLLIFISSVLFLFSCSNKFSLQKRKYTKGYYFGMTSKKERPAVQALAKNKPESKPLKIYTPEADQKSLTEELTAAATGKESSKKRTFSGQIINNILLTAKKNTPLVVIRPGRIKALNSMDMANAGNQNVNNASKPFDLFGSGMGIYAIIGLISGIVSFILLMVYLIFILSALGVISSYMQAVWAVIIVVLIIAAIGLVFIVNSD